MADSTSTLLPFFPFRSRYRTILMGTFDYPAAIYEGNSQSAGVYLFIFTDEDEDLVPRVAQQHRYGQRLREKFSILNYDLK
jgi:hypothetical protein